MKKTPILYLLFLLLPMFLSSQDSLLTAALEEQLHPLKYESVTGTLSGEGLQFLANIAQQHPFFLIGEDHGIAEIPLFTAALFRQFHQYGYRYFATETGPITAAYLQDLASKENWRADYQEFLRAYPWSIPFYSIREECDILDAVLDKAPAQQQQALLWGLDQEFAASFRMHFKALQETAATDTSRQVATRFFEKAMAGHQAFVNEGNPSQSFMASAHPSDFEALREAFTGQEEPLKRIQEIEASIHIYQLWFQRQGYESNRLRAEMMKQHFMDYYSEAQKQEVMPKVMFKFGANHMYRGINGLNVFDIGNFVSELASQQQASSFHLYVIGRKGTKNSYTPFSKSEADKTAPYDPAQYLDKIDFSPLLAAAPETEWAIIDLRPLRKKLFDKSIRSIHPGLEKVIWGYDAVLVIPEVSAGLFLLDE